VSETSKYNKETKVQKMHKSMTSLDTRITTASTGNYCEIGTQGFLEMGICGRRVEILQAYDDGLRTNANWLNLMYRNGSDNTYKMYVTYMKTNSTLSNQSPNTAIITLYDVVCKKDIYDHNYPFQDNGIMLAPWIRGMQQTNGSSTTSANFGIEIVGVVPTQSPEFKKYWNVIKTTKLEIGSGRAHTHIFKYGLNKTLTADQFANVADADGDRCIAGVTMGTLAVFNGTPVDAVPGTPLVADDQISTARVKLISVTQKTIKSRIYIQKGIKCTQTGGNFPVTGYTQGEGGGVDVFDTADPANMA